MRPGRGRDRVSPAHRGSRPYSDGVHCYSLHKAGELEPVLGQIVDGLRGYVDLEGSKTEYGPGRRRSTSVTSRARGRRSGGASKYGVRELAGRAARSPRSWPSPTEIRRATRCTSTCRSGETANRRSRRRATGERPSQTGDRGTVRAPSGDRPVRRADGELLQALPPLSFAPSTRTWGNDNRTVAIRSLIESPSATRVELRTGAPTPSHTGPPRLRLQRSWPGWRATRPTPVNPVRATSTAPATPSRRTAEGIGPPAPTSITEILGEDAVHDYTKLASTSGRRSSARSAIGTANATSS